MGFLDSLEDNMKAMEARGERDTAGLRRQQEEQDRAADAARAAAPWAMKLRTSAFTDELMAACRAAGHQKRIPVRITWIDSTLRFDAREAGMELQPGPDGIRVVFFAEGQETGADNVDLDGDAAALARRWLGA